VPIVVDLSHGGGDHLSVESLFTAGALAAAGVSAALYVVRSVTLRGRGANWPLSRDAAFIGGCAVLAAGTALTLPAMPFTGHIAQHLLVGMIAPLLIVLGRPVTLLLRTLRVGGRRAWVVCVLHTRVVRLAVLPPVAALSSVGGMWALYRTPLFEAIHDRPWLHATVHVHMMITGTLFMAAICQLDPVRRRYGLTVRGATLVAAGAAHAVLAKSLYELPPPNAAITGSDLRMGAQLMYYGGDVVEICIAAVLALTWYAAGGRALAHERRRLRAAAQ
jgi:putative membrane protein